MKILIFYNYRQNQSYNHFCNVDFYQYLNNFHNIEAKFYGIGVDKLFPNLTVCPYNLKLSMFDIHQIYAFDIIIVAGRNRTFIKPKEDESWLPKDFVSYNCPKILVEPDYHKYRKLSWFKDMNFSAILHRHQSNVNRGIEDFPKLPQYWFPFSVDTSIFYPQNKTRINKVCFVGNNKSSSYYFRTKAIEILEKNNMLDNKYLQFESDYINCLQNYTVYLSGSSIFTIDCAKAFEIIASGGILLTNACYNGFPSLFNNNFITYNNDFLNLANECKAILTNTNQQKQIIDSNLKLIHSFHTHEKRCQDLINILNKFYNPIKTINNDILDIVYTIGNLKEDAWLRFENCYRSVSKNLNYRIVVSEVGKESSYDKIKSFIPEFEYHFQQEDLFDASIAKNNAFRYLINNNLFTFLDVDMIVPSDFVNKCFESYHRRLKIFICNYYRLPETEAVNYEEIKSKFDFSDFKLINQSGTLVCDKATYELLNGFDEDYKGWGGRDSDFYERAKLSNKFFSNSEIILFHQYHPRQFGDYKNSNRQLFKQKRNSYRNNPKSVNLIKGLYNIPKTPIDILLDHNIDVCLLKQTCKDWAILKNITPPYYLGVSDINKAKSLNLSDVIFESLPKSTKITNMNNRNVKVPFPLITYLQNLYGDQIRKELK
jgi:spore maturation protein CgeB